MQTRVDFHSHVSDPLGAAAGWLTAAWRRGIRVRVLGDARTLQALDQRLWVADKEGFVPHALCGAAARRPGMERTTIWLGEGEAAGEPPRWLLNLGPEFPPDLAAYERVLEVVGDEPASAEAGRQRWARYKSRPGIDLRHERGLAPEPAAS